MLIEINHALDDENHQVSWQRSNESLTADIEDVYREFHCMLQTKRWRTVTSLLPDEDIIEHVRATIESSKPELTTLPFIVRLDGRGCTLLLKN